MFDPPDIDDRRKEVFARKLRAARTRVGFTQADVAELLGVAEHIYGRYERAQMWPSIRVFRRLCGAVSCSADVLLGFEESAPAAVPPPDDDPVPRWLMRRLRKAHPDTRAVLERVLDEIDGYHQRHARGGGLPEAGGAPSDDSGDARSSSSRQLPPQQALAVRDSG